MHTRTLALICLWILGWTNPALAYPTYSGGTTGNCSGCHGAFRGPTYTSRHDGMSWGTDLHDVHRIDMLGRDCNTCHSGSGRTPVYTNMSNGGDGLAPIACLGCHGRDEGGGDIRAAGLRQHHYRAGIMVCTTCHTDANPATYTTVGEDILPPYYATPGTGHPDMPVDSCNPLGSEDFAGGMTGLDNDGDSVYDTADSDCSTTCTDGDGDGFSPDGGGCGPVDCDDTHDTVNPSASEVCDNLDNDCNGTIDDGLSRGCSTACGSGTETCSAGAWVGCDAPPVLPETCDNVDNDCDGMTDEGLSRMCSTACGTGTETCSMGAWVGCDAPPVLPEVCDGIDNDCDGMIDEGCGACTPGATRMCGTDVGLCTFGTETCGAGGIWGTCTGVGPEPEVCDGADNDCDGMTDEGVRTRFYLDSDGDGYGDPAMTRNRCTAPAGYVDRALDCDDTDAAVNPDAAETCDNVDSDCNGMTDEGLSRACSTACGSGTETCSAGAWVGCDAPPVEPEVCDDVDNDCDGMTDEGLSRACSTACGSGTETCAAGAWVGCDAPLPEAEICDDIDNDCDGTVDEGCACIPAETRACGTDEGECVAGVQTCGADATWGDTCEGEVPPSPEECNGLDDDCDGSIDEELTRSCDNACGPGTETCSTGSWVDCTAPLPEPEICDDMADNDCDGTVDLEDTDCMGDDAGVDAGEDAGVDAGLPPDMKGGCGCSAPGAPMSGALIPFLVVLVALARRRRGRH